MFRVLPKDAFNDANLLKCIGRLTLLILNNQAKDWEYDYDPHEPFDIQQNPDSRSTYVTNIQFYFKGQHVFVSRPMNSRDNYHLLMTTESGEEYYIFDEKGNLHDLNPEGLTK